METIKIATLFLILANIIFLLLVKWRFNNILGNIFTLLASYGLAPLLSGLLFYGEITFFPARNDNVYIMIMLGFIMGIIFYARKVFKKILSIYSNILLNIKNKISITSAILGLLGIIIALIFSIQALFYPIAEGDSAYYFLQSKALRQTMDSHWYKNGSIMIDGLNEYSYNPMIRPGIPSTTASMFTFLNEFEYPIVFKFFSVYYFFLLLGITVFITVKIAGSLAKNKLFAGISASLFFLFYWSMIRFYIFNNKEVSIYFFALSSIYLVANLTSKRKRNIKVEILTGVFIGLNAFINLHGIIIGMLLFGIIAIFSKLPLRQRIEQLLVVSGVNLIFSAFQVVIMFKFIFVETIKQFFSTNQLDAVKNVTKSVAKNTDALVKVEKDHVNMYQVNSFVDMYLKGKLQVFTNIGAYGWYASGGLLIYLVKFKELLSSNVSKIFFLFTVLYYFVLLDPLNINKHPLAVVLWGSPKYSMFVGLLFLIILAVYSNSIINTITNKIDKNKLIVGSIILVTSVISYFLKGYIIEVGVSILSATIKFSRERDFYIEVITSVYYVVFMLTCAVGILLLIAHYIKTSRTIMYRLIVGGFMLFMIAPFFVVAPGKVPTNDTFKFVNYTKEDKLKKVISFGDLFKVYYYAKKTLPKNSKIGTSYLEIYVHNDFFLLSGLGKKNIDYKIDATCKQGSRLFQAGHYSLCTVQDI